MYIRSNVTIKTRKTSSFCHGRMSSKYPKRQREFNQKKGHKRSHKSELIHELFKQVSVAILLFLLSF